MASSFLEATSSDVISQVDNLSDELSESVTSGEKVLYDLLFDERAKSGEETKNMSYLTNESLSYLHELNSFHVDRLQLEPKLLQEKKEQIHEEIQTLAFSNYKTFIRTAQCSREIYSDFSTIESKLDTLVTQLPEFSSKCDNFTKLIQGLNTSRRSNNLTLQKHNQLLEILEISQLMDTCVRNEYYEEALDLANYVKRLEKKFSSSIGIIKNITNDVNESLNLMLKQLLIQLRTNLQFNQCLKIIGLIRRMDVFTESELRVKFLQLRDSWLQSILLNIPTNNPFNHISKTIEEMRVHLFDIITQYKAIFSDEDIISSKDSTDSKLFLCWLQQKIKIFLEILRKDLKLGVGNRIDSILSQAMYFGLAFSRVGLDFRVLMVPLFEEAVLDQVRKYLDIGQLKFEDSLAKVNWSELYLENSKDLVNSFEKEFVQQKEDLSKKTSTINAPTSLLEFQPLAVYLNEILACLNDLRLCAPLNIFTKVSALFKGSLTQLGHIINAYFQKEKSAFDSNEHKVFSEFLYQMCYVMIPFIENCLAISFPITQIQTVLLIVDLDLEKLKTVLKLDLTAILAPSILALIPEKRFKQLVVEDNKPIEHLTAQNMENGHSDVDREKVEDVVVGPTVVEAKGNSDENVPVE